MAAKIAGGGDTPLLPWAEDQDGNAFIQAVLKADTDRGQAGFVKYDNGGPTFYLDTSLTPVVADVLPAVAVESGDATDVVRVQVYGGVIATFSGTYTFLKGAYIAVAAGAVVVESTVAGNARWGIVRVAGTSASTFSVWLSGTFLTGGTLPSSA